ncbi:MAG: DUF1844 domain-containing protein [Planctomycetota bacterium]|jgi:hypothetical protein
MTDQTESSETPKIQIDSDWKAEAQAEKDRLAAQEAKAAESGTAPPGRGGPLPEAEFKTLIGVLASQAIMGLGAMADPNTGRVLIDLEGAQLSIDLLAVLEEKTKGNLSEEEAGELRQVLAELRSRFVQVTQLIARQATPGAPEGVADAPPTA